MGATQTCSVLLLLVGRFSTLASDGYSFGKKSNVVYEVPGDANSRIRGFEDRSTSQHDFVLGGLFSIHDDTDMCATWRSRGVENIESMLFTIDRINADTELLPNISLGYDIRDTCHVDSVGLQETLDLVIRGSRLDYQGETDRLPTVGIVGPAASLVSIPSAGLGQLFKMPQVSYASSSPDLSDKERYGYFLRTIPPDNFQAQAIVDLLLQFNWTLVSIIYSSNSYGIHGRDEILSLMIDNNICVEVDQGIGRDWTETEFKTLVEQLTESSSDIVIGFMSEPDTAPLFDTLTTSESFRQFIWIASDSWSDSSSTIEKYGSFLVGSFGITPHKQYIQEFQTYYLNLSLQSNIRNVWFPQYISFLAGCNITDCENVTTIAHLENYIYEQNSQVPLVIDAVYTFAHSLHQFLLENCYPPLQWDRANGTCKGVFPKGLELVQYMRNVSFNSLSGNNVNFDKNGDVEGIYSVVNVQALTGNRGYRTKVVGMWNGTVEKHGPMKEALNIETDNVQFGFVGISQCHRCSNGHILQIVPSSCCGACVPCLDQNYSVDPTSFTCQICAEGTWGNHPLTGSDGCLHIEEVYLDVTNPWSICIMLLSSFGLIAVIVTLAIFCTHWNTAVVKSSGRELMMLLLVGITVCFCTAFVYVAPPSLGTCIVQRFGLWICYSLIFGTILVKIIHVARIFLKKSNKAEPKYLVFFTFLIVLGEALLSVGSIVYHLPVIDQYFSQHHGENPVYILTCTTDPIPFLVILVAYVSTIIIAATILGMTSYKFPRNFNEAKHIMFCTLSLLIIWIGFIPSYLATVSLHIIIQNAVIAIAIVMSAFIVLFSIYGPKIYIILFFPMKNHHCNTNHPPPEITLGAVKSSQQAVCESMESKVCMIIYIFAKHMYARTHTCTHTRTHTHTYTHTHTHTHTYTHSLIIINY